MWTSKRRIEKFLTCYYSDPELFLACTGKVRFIPYEVFCLAATGHGVSKTLVCATYFIGQKYIPRTYLIKNCSPDCW